MQHNPDPSELGWLAGILDGEGSIYARIRKRSTGELRPFIEVCAVANTNWKVIERAKEILWKITGRAFRATPYQRGTNKKIWLVFITKKRTIAAVLSALHPHMVGKKDQAEKAIKLCEWNCRPNETVPVEMMQLAKEIKSLNANPPGPVESKGERLDTPAPRRKVQST